MAPDFFESLVGTEGDEKESVVTVETAFKYNGVPMGMPNAKFPKCLMAGDHGPADVPACGLREVAREEVEEQPADVGKEIPVMTKKDAQDLGNSPDELTVRQAQQEVLAEVLSQEESAFLGAGGAKEKAFAGERTEQVVAAVGKWL